MPKEFGRLNLEIVKVGNSYAVGENGSRPSKAPSADSKLLIKKGGVSGAKTDLTLHAVLDDGKLTLVTSDPSNGHVVVRYRADRPSRSEYVAAVAALRERQVQWWMKYLSEALDFWAKKHGGVYPKPQYVQPGSPFATWLTKLSPNIGWPFNPYTGKSMTPGSDPGEYTYASDGSSFTLVGHLPDDRSYIRHSGESGIPPGVTVTP